MPYPRSPLSPSLAGMKSVVFGVVLSDKQREVPARRYTFVYADADLVACESSLGKGTPSKGITVLHTQRR